MVEESNKIKWASNVWNGKGILVHEIYDGCVNEFHKQNPTVSIVGSVNPRNLFKRVNKYHYFYDEEKLFMLIKLRVNFKKNERIILDEVMNRIIKKKSEILETLRCCTRGEFRYVEYNERGVKP